jgi:hypothetical protein
VYYQELGYMVGKVDCTGSRRRPSHDLFGFADLIGFATDGDGLVVVLIQLTNRSSHAKHRNKILMSTRAYEVVRRFGGRVRIDLISWKIMAGERKYTPWVEDMNQTIMEQP